MPQNNPKPKMKKRKYHRHRRPFRMIRRCLAYWADIQIIYRNFQRKAYPITQGCTHPLEGCPECEAMQ